MALSIYGFGKGRQHVVKSLHAGTEGLDPDFRLSRTYRAVPNLLWYSQVTPAHCSAAHFTARSSQHHLINYALRVRWDIGRERGFEFVWDLIRGQDTGRYPPSSTRPSWWGDFGPQTPGSWKTRHPRCARIGCWTSHDTGGRAAHRLDRPLPNHLDANMVTRIRVRIRVKVKTVARRGPRKERG